MCCSYARCFPFSLRLSKMTGGSNSQRRHVPLRLLPLSALPDRPLSKGAVAVQLAFRPRWTTFLDLMRKSAESEIKRPNRSAIRPICLASFLLQVKRLASGSSATDNFTDRKPGRGRAGEKASGPRQNNFHLRRVAIPADVARFTSHQPDDIACELAAGWARLRADFTVCANGCVVY